MKSALLSVFFLASLIVSIPFATTPASAQLLSTPDRVLLHQPVEKARPSSLLGAPRSFVDTVLGRSVDVSDGETHDFLGTIGNISVDPLGLYFVRRAVFPAGWSSSICFGDLCFGTDVDTQGQVFAPGENKGLTIHIIPAMTDYPDSGTMYLTLGANSGNPGDTEMFVLKAYFTPGNPPLIFRFNDSKPFNWSFVGGAKHIIKKAFQNRAGTEMGYKFSMQSVMPAGWIDTLRVAKLLSRPDTQIILGAVNSGFDIQPVQIDVLPAAPFTHRDSAVFYLSARPNSKNTADSANFRLVAVVNDFSFVTPTKNSFAGSGDHSDTGTFTNYSTIPVTYRFSAPASLPKGWTSRFTVGDSVSDGREISYTFAGVNDAVNNHRLVTFTANSPSLSVQDSATFNFKVYRADDIPDSASYQLPLYVAASSAVGAPATSTEHAGIAVLNAWPNPLVAASRLNLEIVTDRDERAVAYVYDMTGAEKASIDLGHLNKGTNKVQLSASGLPSGDYIIRIEQGEAASEPVRVNYVR